MPRTDIPVTRITQAGVAPAAQVAGTVDGQMFPNSGRIWVEIVNTAAAPRTITFITPGLVGDRGIDDLAVVVPASATRRYGPFEVEFYNQPPSSVDAGKLYVNHDVTAPTTTTIAAYTV